MLTETCHSQLPKDIRDTSENWKSASSELLAGKQKILEQIEEEEQWD